MAIGGTTAAAIQAIDDSARSLYRRARAGGPEFADVAVVVRSLHTVLKHLRVEAEDHDSLLNAQQQQASVYARQLTPLVEDCDFTLKQLETIFEKYGPRDGHEPRAMEEREKNMISLIRTKLANQKTNIDMFLDTIQLHNPAKAHHALPLDTDSRQLEGIKDKVDTVARRLFQQRNARSATGDTSDELWQQFSTELIKEGFSSEVLHRNREVVRAYIRELDTKGLLDNGSVPSVRGLLPPNGAGHVVAGDMPGAGHGTSPPPPPEGDTSPKEVYHPRFENEKFALDVKDARIMPGRLSPQYHPAHVSHPPPPSQPPAPGPLSPVLYNEHTNVSYDPYTSDESDSDDGRGASHQSALISRRLELISTRDLMELDRREQEYMAGRMDELRLSPGLPPPPIYSVSPGTSPNGGLLGPPDPAANSQALATSPNSLQLSSSPRYVPSLPGYSPLSPPPAYGSSPIAEQLGSSYPPHPTQSNMRTKYQQIAYKLAPDPYGQDIPLDAKWTKIRRSLVSPAVLEQAKLRYEARPTFVAVLGMLSRAQIEEFARRTAELRNARGQAYRQKPGNHRPTYQPYGGKHHSRRSGSTSDSDSDTLWDESDTTEDERHASRKGYSRDRYVPRADSGKKELDDDKGTKVYPFIVSPPSAEVKASPASTVQPKPILKNKNENHVRFEADGPVEITPAELAKEQEREERRERRRERDRDHNRDHDRDRDRDRRRRRDHDRDRERDRDGHRRRDHRDRDRDRDHDQSRRHTRDSNREGARDRREDRSRDERQDDRAVKKASLRETFGAVSIGGAAATLLSVLTEAAVGI